MKKIIPATIVVFLIIVTTFSVENGLGEDNGTATTCDQGFCTQSGASGVTINVYDSGGNLVFQCVTDDNGCCPNRADLEQGNTYTAEYVGSTCAHNSVTFTACTPSYNLAVPGCP